ncbi:MAG: von Willebrand factor type A domain-containing protein [Candidatus Sericytochromatia bacterium]|nr:von Willebrand factor type A domain-containing protein [Candidatus Sericytochromatia bacterium]
MNKSLHTSSARKALLMLSLSFGLLLACSSPDATPTSPNQPSPSGTAMPSAEPTAEPTAEPSAGPEPTAAPTAAPSAEPSPTPAPTSSPGSTPSIYDYRENFFQNYKINPFVEAATDPLSTFSVDVDTGSYTLARSYLNQGLLPPPAAIRPEEFINAFRYDYAQPLSGAFALQTALGPSYFGTEQTRLLKVGLQGREILSNQRKQAVLTLLIDVSGSMNRENRLGLVKQSLNLLLNELRPDDRVAIITLGTDARMQLDYTPAGQRALIQQVIDNLRPEGSTNTEAGLKLAYQAAKGAFVQGAENRIILCSDGVVNIGERGPESLLALARSESQQGISLTTLGFGLQGFNDYLMEQLANQGDGYYAYIDTLAEAQRVLVRQLTSMLQVIARDVKIQVAFDPELVDQYRLLGYENRDIADEDFRNDNIDAGEVGSNHSVTALYELRFKPDLRQNGEIATVSVRYQDAADQQIKEFSESVQADQLRNFTASSEAFKLATAVAGFAELLRDSLFIAGRSFDDILELIDSLSPNTRQRADVQELRRLVETAKRLKNPRPAVDFATLLSQSENPRELSNWQNYLLQQLGGNASQQP